MLNRVKISIIIVNWKSRDDLRTCLQSIWTKTKESSFEVLVVDNASYDGCAEMLEREFPSVIFLQSNRNLGFAGANNLAAKKASGDILLFLNPDTELLENTIFILAKHLTNLPGAAAVGCRLLNRDRCLQTSCVQAFPTVLNQLLDSDFLRDKFPASKQWGTSVFLSQDKKPQPVEAVSGACLMMQRSVFTKVGGFTEGYFMYGEDLDLCYKVHRAGYLVFHVPETAVLHFGGSSTEKQRIQFSNIMMRESVFRFMQFNRNEWVALEYRGAMIVCALIRLVLILPLRLFRSRTRKKGSSSLSKWAAILRWGIGLESWVLENKD